MKESIAQAFIVNLILFFFIILALLLFGSINYSKAYKVKNRIITIIEKYGYFSSDSNSSVLKEIDENLKSAGYNVVNQQNINKCAKLATSKTGARLVYPDVAQQNQKHYHFCVFEYKDIVAEGGYKEANARYYQVVAYMKFDVPLFGGFLEFPVQGETKVMYDYLNS